MHKAASKHLSVGPICTFMNPRTPLYDRTSIYLIHIFSSMGVFFHFANLKNVLEKLLLGFSPPRLKSYKF